MRSRKGELAELVDLLSAEHESVEDLAGKVWDLVDRQRAARDVFLVAVNHGHGLVLAYGLYVTENAARKDMAKFRSQTGNEKAFVLRLVDPAAMFNLSDSDSYR